MSRSSKFSPEVQERADRMVEESRGEHVTCQMPGRHIEVTESLWQRLGHANAPVERKMAPNTKLGVRGRGNCAVDGLHHHMD